MSNRLFCYGTLQIPDVFKAATGKTHKGIKAKLPGYAMYKVRNAGYPGVVRSSNSETAGILYTNISEEDLELIDLFEGDFFTRKLLNVIQQSNKMCKAWVYILSDRNKDKLTNDPWILKDFLKNDLKDFISSIEEDQ